MNPISTSHIISIGLAIFSMLFGAGNLMYPILVGMISGTHINVGLFGFLITAVCLPIFGLIGMILFHGNYHEFFTRLGKTPGALLIAACMLIIGPLIAIPRIVTLSHTMIAPFLPFTFLQDTHNPLASFVFSLLFLGITFLTTYRENKIMDILGHVISPLLLFSLAVIVIKGIISAHTLMPTDMSAWQTFKTSFMTGYETLDLLGALFFASIVMNILKKTLPEQAAHNPRTLAAISAKAGILGVLLLGVVYLSMGLLGAFHGYNFLNINAGELFREIAFAVLGSYGAAFIGTAVIMACLSTAIALSAVVADYTQKVIFNNTISYVSALILVVMASIPLSTVGLSMVLKLTGGPIVYIGYPVIIMLTVCNIAHKLFNIKTVKIPVLLTFLVTFISYYFL